MQELHVLTRREELDPSRLHGKVVVVVDVLFATSTLIAALQRGALEVIAVADEAAARAEASRHAPGSYLLAGEKNMEIPPGFASFAPRALLRHELAGKRLIYSTTNGTVALRQAQAAPYVYAAALLNGEAVADKLCVEHADEPILILCAGSVGRLNLEDFYGAGYLVDRVLAVLPHGWALSDAAVAAHGLYQHFGDDGAEDCLLRSRVGRLMLARGGEEEVRFAAQLSTYSVVPSLQDGRIK